MFITLAIPSRLVPAVWVVLVVLPIIYQTVPWGLMALLKISKAILPMLLLLFKANCVLKTLPSFVIKILCEAD